jgi:ABC-type transporter Mla MlaB component
MTKIKPVQISHADIIQRAPQELHVIGVLDFSSVPGLLASMSKLLRQVQTGHVRIDLSGVDDVNSAAITLLFEIQNQAASRGIMVNFINTPESLMAIARVYGIEKEFREICK